MTKMFKMIQILKQNCAVAHVTMIITVVLIFRMYFLSQATRSKTCVYCLSLAGIAGSNSTGNIGALSLVSAVCCQVEVSATFPSLFQRCPTVCCCV